MDLIVIAQSKSTLCRVSGDVDISTSGLLRERLLAVLQHPRVHLVVDLSGVTFMDASGLGALMAARRRSTVLGGAVRLLAPSSPVKRVLQASGLAMRFSVAPNPSTDPGLRVLVARD
ncbi:STAS domain-containing protein [Sphaerisporangium sp. TRM90804]|uniref:STAS domain-containing protein n=1 Tax=Sphaerisporangium sp. TRM90804 TaxID=3031113 RepID=UPI00244CB55F|nr:STAS domain-containing protein [Sphaerisporangium sp. TRM90804]MDH2424946.1 STAS domain-containing protein [Sphaerisporangium sp. TRM90804]